MTKVAFTLAEVLITLGIIGVVAVMTIPNLVQKARERATVTKVKQTYSILTRAYNYAINEYGTPEGWSDATNNVDTANHHENFINKLKPYLKLSEDCIGKTQTYSRAHCYKNANASTSYSYIRLINGVTLSVKIWNKNCDSNYADSSKNITCGTITVYTDPFASNIKNGTNAFNFFITKEGIMPYGKENSLLKFEKACNTSIENPYPWYSSLNMYGCTAWVIYNENMDYLHCTDLSWKGKHKCKD